MPCARTPACGVGPSGRRQRLVVGHLAGRAATGRSARRSSPPPSRGCRSRRPSAGRAARRRSAAWDRPRAGASGSVPRRNRGEDVGAEAGDPPVKAPARVGDQLEHGAVELDHLGVALRMRSHAGRGARRQRPPGATTATSRSCAGASGSPARPRSAGTGACRGRRPPDGAAAPGCSGQRSAPKRGWGVATASGTWPSSTGRIRLAA